MDTGIYVQSANVTSYASERMVLASEALRTLLPYRFTL